MSKRFVTAEVPPGMRQALARAAEIQAARVGISPKRAMSMVVRQCLADALPRLFGESAAPAPSPGEAVPQ